MDAVLALLELALFLSRLDIDLAMEDNTILLVDSPNNAVSLDLLLERDSDEGGAAIVVAFDNG